jgi:4-aminobutyrate aminotransferase / (S)-3-amino-2-methylpropionate transaminase / 5-aminovalerate transaminase
LHILSFFNLKSYEFNLISRTVPLVESKYRKIVTKIPPQKTLECFSDLSKNEPNSMLNELPVLWDHAIGYQIFDSSGNCWLDFTSGIFVTNVGHGHPKIINRIKEILDKPLLHNYYFLSDIRRALTKKLIQITPDYLNKAFLLTTGSEAAECALKITRIYGKKINPEKNIILSFDGAMHGKTLGSLMVGGKHKEKSWIGHLDPNILHLPFPFDGFCPWKNEFHECDEICFQESTKKISDKIDPNLIAGFFIESYQGWGAMFYPKNYLKELVRFCKKYNILLIFDEIQSGFGRTGKLFAFEHYDVKPDIVCCGKGISSSLPLSVVLGRQELLNSDPSLNSTHGGNPLCCAATLASLEVIESENLIFESKRKGILLEKNLQNLQLKYRDIIKNISGKGLIFAIHVINRNTHELDSYFVDQIIEKCMEKGLLLVRTSSGTIKIGPPLSIPDDALKEGIYIIDESISELLSNYD